MYQSCTFLFPINIVPTSGFHFPFLTIVIRIDLANDLVAASKYYARVKAAFSHNDFPRFSMRIQWHAPDSSVCPSSIAKYFADKQYACEQIVTTVKSHQEYSLEMPEISDDHQQLRTDPSEFYATAHECAEYLGILTLACNRDRNEYVNSYQCVGRSVEVGHAKVVQWSGMFSCFTVWKLFIALQ